MERVATSLIRLPVTKVTNVQSVQIACGCVVYKSEIFIAISGKQLLSLDLGNEDKNRGELFLILLCHCSHNVL